MRLRKTLRFDKAGLAQRLIYFKTLGFWCQWRNGLRKDDTDMQRLTQIRVVRHRSDKI